MFWIACFIFVEHCFMKIITTRFDLPWFILVLYSVLQDYINCFGFLVFIIPILLGKFKPLRYVLSLKSFSVLSRFLLVFSVIQPIIILRYYYEQHQLIKLSFF